MPKKVKSKVKKSVTQFDTVFADGTYQCDSIKVSNDRVSLFYNCYNDEAEADDDGTPLPNAYNTSIEFTEETPAGKVTAVMAVISTNTDAEKMTILANCLLEIGSDILVADTDSDLFGGTVESE